MFEAITNFEFAILNIIQEFFRCTFLDIIMPVFGTIGNLGMVWIAIAIVMMFFRKTRSTAFIMLFAMLAGLLIGELLLKNTICRVRPCNLVEIDMLISKPSSYSFPSGHTCSAFAAATVLLRFNKKFGIPALVLAIIIGFSRLYNYVHFPTDVLAGAVLGIVCGLFMWWMFNKFGWKSKIDKLGIKK